MKSYVYNWSHKITLPYDKEFHQLQELRVLSPQNNSNLIDKILSSTKSLQRFNLQLCSKIIHPNRLKFMQTIQHLFMSQPNLYEINGDFWIL